MDLSVISPEIIDKLDFRKRSLESMSGELNKKKTRLKKLWDIRLANQMAELAHFEEVYRAVKRAFRGAGLLDT